MQYKISYEPFYFYESFIIIQSIINDQSIKDHLEAITKKYGAIVRDELEPLFLDAISLEDYIKENLCFNFPGYENNGAEIAKFLFKLRERLEEAPAAVFMRCEQLLNHCELDNKRLAVLAYVMEDRFFSENWDVNPPILDDDKAFFDILDAGLTDSAEKFDIIKLCHNFDLYRDYVSKLIEQTIILYKEKLPVFSEAITACMNYIETQLNEDSTRFFKKKLRLTINDELIYTLCPSVYFVNSCMLTGVRWNLHIIFGVYFFDKSNLLANRVDSETESIQDFLKCIADSSKLSIIQMLKNEPMYGSQLAEKLNLTTATISHHMSTMLKLQLVYAEKKNNKVYFNLDRERLKEMSEKVQKLLIYD